MNLNINEGGAHKVACRKPAQSTACCFQPPRVRHSSEVVGRYAGEKQTVAESTAARHTSWEKEVTRTPQQEPSSYIPIGDDQPKPRMIDLQTATTTELQMWAARRI